MTGTMLIYDPTAPAASESRVVRRSIDALAGKTVAFIDNAKPNFHLLVDDLAELLTRRYGVARIVKRAKRGPSMPAASDVVDELVAQSNVIITGSGD